MSLSVQKLEPDRCGGLTSKVRPPG